MLCSDTYQHCSVVSTTTATVTKGRERAYSVCPYQGCGDSGRDDDDIVKGAELLTRERDDWIGLEAVVVTYRCQR